MCAVAMALALTQTSIFCGTFCAATAAAAAAAAAVIHCGNSIKTDQRKPKDAYDCPDMDSDCISINRDWLHSAYSQRHE